MLEPLKIEVTFDKIPPRRLIVEHVKIRVNSRPRHLRGAEVKKIAEEMEISPRAVRKIISL